MVGQDDAHITTTMRQAFESARRVAEFHAAHADVEPEDLLHDAWRFLAANAGRLAREGREGMSFTAVVEFFGRRAVQASARRERISRKYAKKHGGRSVLATEPSDAIEREEMFAEIMSEVERLCPKYRKEVAGLLEGLSIQELAIRLNQPPTTVESRVARAKRRLATSGRLQRLMQLLLSLPPFALLLLWPRKSLAQTKRGNGALVASSCMVAMLVVLGASLLDVNEVAPTSVPMQFDAEETTGDAPRPGAQPSVTPLVGVRDVSESTTQVDSGALSDAHIAASIAAAIEESADAPPIPFAGFPQEYVEYYHDTGTVKIRYTLLNGKLHGVLTSYRKNGTRRRATDYVNGVAHGVGSCYNSTGREAWRHVTYENGKEVKWEIVGEDDN